MSIIAFVNDCNKEHYYYYYCKGLENDHRLRDGMPNGGMPNGENDVLRAEGRTSLGAMLNGHNAEN